MIETFATRRRLVCWLVLTALGAGRLVAEDLTPLPPLEHDVDNELVDLGRTLFFDGRLSGDATTSCAACHDPQRAFTDGLALAKGYPGSLYFRNTPTLINVADQEYFYWDGRMSGDDLPSLIRDHISEAHFMQADGRLIIERLRQVPEYEAAFAQTLGGEPSYGRILKALAAYVLSLRSRNVPLDRYLAGDPSAMSAAAIRGFQLFTGKADCNRCHHGSLLSDGGFHHTGVPTNRSIFAEPERHITFRRFMRTIGIGQCATLRKDIGYGCVSKVSEDYGKFRTPSLREVARTAPYMHNGVYATLEEVVDHYNSGSDQREELSELKPLSLSDEECADLIEFLQHLSGDEIRESVPQLPAYALRHLGEEPVPSPESENR